MNVCAAHEPLTSPADVISMEKWTLATSPAECSIMKLLSLNIPWKVLIK